MIPIATVTFPSTDVVTFVDSSATYTGTKLHISGSNSFTATGHATVSDLTKDDVVQFYLRLLLYEPKTSNHPARYRVIHSQQTEATSDTVSSAQTFKIPTIKHIGKIVYDYQVIVRSKDITTANKYFLEDKTVFTLESYTPPTLANLSAERYSIRPSDTGSSNILTADNAGEYVRFSFTLTPAVTTVSGNSWTLNVKATSGSGKTQNKNSAYTGTTSGITKTDDTTIFPSASFSFDAKEDWTFTFTITDKVTGTSYSTQVAKAESILNVEPGGVAVGGFLSTGNALAANNLILGSDIPVESSAYMIHEYTLSEPFQLNQDYTLTIWGALGEGKDGFAAFIDNGSNNVNHGNIHSISDGVYSATVNRASWVVATTTATKLSIYAMPNSVTGVTTRIDRIKLEKGRVALPTWTINPQDRAEVTPFSQPKRFETSDDCGAILRGGLWDARGYRMDYVNNTTLLPIDNATFEPYYREDTGITVAMAMPMISRVGPIVFMEGALRNKKAITLDLDGITLCTLPAWARPRMRVSQVCQGTNNNVFWLRVEVTGEVIMSRYRDSGSGYNTAGVGAQFLFTLSWLAADAAPPLPSIT